MHASLMVAPLFERASRGSLRKASLLQELVLEVQLLIMTELPLLHCRVSIAGVRSLRREQFLQLRALRGVHMLQQLIPCCSVQLFLRVHLVRQELLHLLAIQSFEHLGVLLGFLHQT